MRLLLDTHTLLWSLDGDQRLGHKWADEIVNRDNEVFFSAASIWEMVIKAAPGKLRVDSVKVPGTLLAEGFTELPVSGRHAAEVANLAPHHRDPFDRLPVAQCRVEAMQLPTSDNTPSLFTATASF